MSRRDEPAYPSIPSTLTNAQVNYGPGLTIREDAILRAMQGLVCARGLDYEVIARSAVIIADSVLDAMEAKT